MQSQLLVGGAKLEDVPAFRAILAREHKRIRGESQGGVGGVIYTRIGHQAGGCASCQSNPG